MTAVQKAQIVLADDHPALLAEAARIYGQRFAMPDGRVRATFEIIYLSGWGPAETQQKPLRPGAAQFRLADALGTEERPAGDVAAPAIPLPIDAGPTRSPAKGHST